MPGNTDNKEMVVCGICNDYFLDPRILPCLHTFCANCIIKQAKQEKLTETVQSGPSQEKSTGASICCPYCKVQYSESIIRDAPPNRSAACLVQILNKKPPTCQVCEDTDCVSVALCYDCPCFLCEECAKSHARQKRDHKIKRLSEINDLQFCPSVLPIFKICPDHSTKPMKFYCQDDKSSICEECINEKHKGHVYTPIVGVIDSKKRNYQEALDNCRGKVDDLQQAVNRMKRLKVHMAQRKDENIQALDNFFHKITKDILDARKNEMKHNVVGHHASREKILQSQEDSLESLLSQFKAICTFAENMLQYRAAQDVIDFEHKITKQSRHLNNENRIAVLTPKAEEQKLIKFLNEGNLLEPFSHLVQSFSHIGSCVNLERTKMIGPKTTKVLVGEKVLFSVIVYPLYDHYMLDLRSLTVQVHYFNSANHEVSTEDVTIKRVVNCDDDRYEMSYTPTKSGDHMVSVLIEGQHIPRSPFK